MEAESTVLDTLQVVSEDIHGPTWMEVHGASWQRGVTQLLDAGDYLLAVLSGGSSVHALPRKSLKVHSGASEKWIHLGLEATVTQACVISGVIIVATSQGDVRVLPVSDIGKTKIVWELLWHGSGQILQLQHVQVPSTTIDYLLVSVKDDLLAYRATDLLVPRHHSIKLRGSGDVAQIVQASDFLVIASKDGTIRSLPLADLDHQTPTNWTVLAEWDGTTVDRLHVVEKYLVAGLGATGGVRGIPLTSLGTAKPAWTTLKDGSWQCSVAEVLETNGHLVVGLANGAIQSLSVGKLDKSEPTWTEVRGMDGHDLSIMQVVDGNILAACGGGVLTLPVSQVGAQWATWGSLGDGWQVPISALQMFDGYLVAGLVSPGGAYAYPLTQMRANFDDYILFLHHDLRSTPDDGVAYTYRIQNKLEVALRLYRLTDHGALGFLAELAPGVGGNCRAYSPKGYIVVMSAATGALAAVLRHGPSSDNAEVNLDQTWFLGVNAIGSPPKPSAEAIIPQSSPSVLVGCGKLPNGHIVAREQYWRRLPDSYSLPAKATKTVSYQHTSGMTRTSSSQTTVSTSVSADVNAGWGPVSATMAASLNKSSTQMHQVSIHEETTRYMSETLTNTHTSKTLVWLNWQLTDVYNVFDSKGTPPASTVAIAQSPTIFGDPYDPNTLTSARLAPNASSSKPAVDR